MRRKSPPTSPGGCRTGCTDRALCAVLFPLIIFVCGSIVLQGCTTMSPLRESGGIPEHVPPDRNLRFTFTDGSVAETGPYQYVVIREPDDFVYGEGTLVSKATGKTTAFSGKFIPLSFDQTGRFNTFSLSDSEYVRFRPGEYVVVRRTAGTGLFFASRDLGLSPDSTYTWRRPAGDIRLIEESSVSVWKTALLATGIIVPLAAFGILVELGGAPLGR